VDPRTWSREDRFAWFEETLCETASLFALRAMARVWACSPPYAPWQSYSAHLADYADDLMLAPEHTRSPVTTLPEWLKNKLPELKAQFSVMPPTLDQCQYNAIIAKELLPVFEADPRAWRTVRYLHFPNRPHDLVDFFVRWRAACPAEDRPFVERVADVLLSSSTNSLAGSSP
jgi:hypothetical protein